MTFRVASTICAVACLVVMSGAVWAGEIAPPQTPVDPLEDGALVFHGNYCGPGSKGHNPPPTDALDEACMHHDHCSPNADSGIMAKCSCDQRLKEEATRVAADMRQPEDLRVMAQTVADGATLMPCQPDR